MVNEKNVACKKMYGTIKGKNRLYEKKTVNRSCQYEFVETLRKRNCTSRQVFVPDLQKKHALSTLLSATPG